MEKKNSGEKALFIQRLIAFLIDILIVTTLTSIIATPFVNDKKLNSLTDEANELVEKYLDKKITMNEYAAEYINVTYDIAKESGFLSVIQILLSIVLYVIFPLYCNGQTIGKKIMKIKIISDGDLTSNQLVFRAFIANELLVDILILILLIFTSRSVYFYGLGIFKCIQYAITGISVLLVICTKDGLSIHDRLVHTKVIKA